MGLFSIFGGKKGEEDAQKEKEQSAALQKESVIAEAKAAHADMEWPGFPKLNPVNVESSKDVVMDETVTAERKDELGEMIYDEISPDTFKFVSNQELLFILTALEVYHKASPLPEFEANHRKAYNELLDRVRNAEFLYVLYDSATGFPFIDHGFANVYFEKEIAEKATELFKGQFRNLNAKEIKVENTDPNGVKRGFFDYLYYIGIENIIVDNGAYRARFKRSEIVAAPGDWGGEKDNNPVNPTLNYAMLDFLEELRWPVKYEKREEIVRATEMRMLSLIRGSHFIIPMQHEGPVEVLEDGRMKFNKDTKFKFLVMNSADGKQFLPLYTDGIEFSKKLRGTGWNAAVFKYQDILKFVQDKEGIAINPDGQNVVLPKERMFMLEAAGQQADQMKRAAGKAPTPSANNNSNSEDAAVMKALNQAMTRMNEKKDQ